MNSYLYQFYKFWVRPTLSHAPKPTPENTEKFVGYDSDPRWREGGLIQGVDSDFKRLNERLVSEGKQVVIILVPTEFEVRDDAVDGAFFPAIREIGAKYDIPVIDALPALRKARQAGLKVYGSVYDGDTHLHANGTRVVAMLAFDWFAANLSGSK